MGTRGPNQLHKLSLHGVTLGGDVFRETVMGWLYTVTACSWASYNDQTAVFHQKMVVIVRESPPNSLKSSGLGIFTNLPRCRYVFV